MASSILPGDESASAPDAVPSAAVTIERIEGIARWPGLRGYASRRYDRLFEVNVVHNLFRGVFETGEAAAASAPVGKPLGYDNEESAALYLGKTLPEPYDYPAMLWLSNAIVRGARSVFDVGGHVGMKYYAFEHRVEYPADLRWTVCDVPAVVRRGRQMAERRDTARRLAFTDDYATLDGCDVLFASGVLQYLPMTLDAWLDTLRRPPTWIVVNTAALHPRHAFFTLNSIGSAHCPYRVQRESVLVDALAARGYVQRDRWTNPGKAMRIPFHRDESLDDYVGMALERR